jgi:hypothetical protein
MIAPTKPGYQTTEFWLSLAATVVGALLASGAIEAGTVWDRIAGTIAATLAAMGYSSARAKVKAP